MRYTLSRLLAVWILVVSCDTESIANSFSSANPPEFPVALFTVFRVRDVFRGKPLGQAPKCSFYFNCGVK